MLQSPYLEICPGSGAGSEEGSEVLLVLLLLGFLE